HLATAAAVLGWLIVEWGRNKAPTTIGAATGAVAGLVAITPAAGYIEAWAAVVLGLAAGVICYIAVSMKSSIGYDDSLDVVGVHMVGGIVGALLTGVFATTAINEAGGDGLLYGNPGQFGKQAIAVGATLVYSFVASLIILKLADMLVGVRVTEDEELRGLDITQHSESAYSDVDVGTVMSHSAAASGRAAESREES
ncbi:MAG: ammonium transporter, partial [Actinomycetota bacterium]